MVPENAFSSLSDNSAMLQIIFFALLLGYFITQTDEGYTSTNAYMAKSGGKYAKSAADPLNYSFIFVLAMAVGAFEILLGDDGGHGRQPGR